LTVTSYTEVTTDRSQPTFVGSYRSLTPGHMYFYVDMSRRDKINMGGSYPFPTREAAERFLIHTRERDDLDGFPDRVYEINAHVHTPTASKERH